MTDDKNVWRVGVDGSGHLRGSAFHDRIAAPFHRDAAGQGRVTKRRALVKLLQNGDQDLDQRLPLFLRDHYLAPYLKKQGESLSMEETAAMALAVQRWGLALASFVDSLPETVRKEPESLVQTVFQPPEQTLRAEYAFPNGDRLIVTGRFDSLLFKPDSGDVVVLEFKGHKASEISEELTQVALYAWLIRQATGQVPSGWVLYLEEDEEPARFSWPDMKDVLDRLPGLFDQMRTILRNEPNVPRTPRATLCEHCPHLRTCESEPPKKEAPEGKKKNLKEKKASKKKVVATDPKPSVSQPEQEQRSGPVSPNATDVTSLPAETEEAQRRMTDLIELLGQFQLPVTSAGWIVGPRFIRLKILPDISKKVTVARLINKSRDLQVAMSLGVPPLIQPQCGHVSIDVPRQSILPLTLGDLLREGAATRPASGAAFPLGAGIDGSVFWADLSDPTMTSLLVGGTSGSGKSILLRSILVGLALSNAPGSIRFTLIDPKRVTFLDCDDLACLDGGVIMDVPPALERLERLVGDMEDRYRLLADAKTHDLASYNRTASHPLPRRVVLIDEYADMIIDKESRQCLETAIQRLGQKGRAAGFHLVLATQRPDAKVVTPLIKANLQLKVALKVTTATNSSIILDQSGAEYLVGNGDMLIGGSRPVQRLQGAMPTKTELDQLREME